MPLFPFVSPPPVALRLAAVRPFPLPAVLRSRRPVPVLQWAPGPKHAGPGAPDDPTLKSSRPTLSPPPAAGDGPAVE